MKKQRIQVSNIQIGANRVRKNIDAETVKAIAASIEKIGLQNPISVYFADDYPVDGELVDNVAVLVSGAHRRAALMSLGPEYEYVDCVVFDDKATARKWEISENLHRKELTVDERSEHIAEWIALTEERMAQEVQSGQVAPIESKRADGKGHRPEGGIAAASRELGIEPTAAKRAVKIASRTPEAKEAARAFGLDNNQKALLEIASVEPDKQVAKVEEIAARKSKAVKTAPPKKSVTANQALEAMAMDIVANKVTRPKASSDDFEFHQLTRIFNAASVATKRRFKEWVAQQFS